MALAKIVRISGRAVHVAGDDIDTDRIIPARFLRCVSFDGLGPHLFHDVRFAEDGSPKPHPLNDPRFAGASVLFVNKNFGCGSSREHAPQAIAKSGFRAVVGESFAEIFFGNATALGIPCVSVAREALLRLAEECELWPATELSVDLAERTVSAGELRYDFEMKPGARDSLLAGEWDPIGQLLENAGAAKKLAERLPYLHF